MIRLSEVEYHCMPLIISGLRDYHIYTGANRMDNCETCCNGGWGGYCDNDLFIRFEDRLGNACQTRWLTNNMRVKRGQHGTNGDDAFDGSSWDSFNWSEALCASGNGFYVPNKVKSH